MQCFYKNQFFAFAFLLISSFILYLYYNADVSTYFSNQGKYLGSKIVRHIWGDQPPKPQQQSSSTPVNISSKSYNNTQKLSLKNEDDDGGKQNFSSALELEQKFEKIFPLKYFKNFHTYDNDLILPGPEKIVVFHSRIYGQPLWMLEKFSRDGIFFRLNDGGYDCPHRCAFTHDRNFSKSAHALVFSLLDSLYHPDAPVIPDQRPPNQFWIGQTWEAGLNHARFTSQFFMDSTFNWTATYRLDSDVPMLYGYFEKEIDPKNVTGSSQPPPQSFSPQLLDPSGSKKELAVALASNCQSYSGREELIESMRKFVPVKVYGKCGQPCPNDTDCRQFLAQRFKFMLSFENSLCEDYVTEKFFMALHHNMVPVVYGLANYKRLAPPRSFINVLDFPSIQALTEYLQFLDKNDEEYIKYFDWKQRYEVRFDREKNLCDLCAKLWNPRGNPRKEYKSFSRWWVSKQPPNYFEEKEEFDLFSEERNNNNGSSIKMEENLLGLEPQFRKKIVERDKACFSGRILLKELLMKGR